MLQFCIEKVTFKVKPNIIEVCITEKPSVQNSGKNESRKVPMVKKSKGSLLNKILTRFAGIDNFASHKRLGHMRARRILELLVVFVQRLLKSELFFFILKVSITIGVPCDFSRRICEI